MLYAFDILLVVWLASTVSWGAEIKGCPPPDLVKPCVCAHSPHTYLQCEHLGDPEVLKNVFDKSSNYRFKEVHLEYSLMQYLPHDVFQGASIKEIHLKNVTLVELFDEPPENLDMLDTLHIENTIIFRGMSWELLANMTSLRVLNIYFNSIPTLQYDFTDHVSESLEQLSFYKTETSFLTPAVFSKFIHLDKISLDNCELSSINRNVFPKIFNARFIYLNENNLRSIPDDLFTNMPKLRTVGLRHNKLLTLPESAFGGHRLEYLMVEGNPITCDCKIVWLMKKRPHQLTGNCRYPESLSGKHLSELERSNFYCSWGEELYKNL